MVFIYVLSPRTCVHIRTYGRTYNIHAVSHSFIHSFSVGLERHTVRTAGTCMYVQYFKCSTTHTHTHTHTHTCTTDRQHINTRRTYVLYVARRLGVYGRPPTEGQQAGHRLAVLPLLPLLFRRPRAPRTYVDSSTTCVRTVHVL